MDFVDIKEILTTVAVILIPILFGYLSELKKKISQHRNDSASRPRNVSSVHAPRPTPLSVATTISVEEPKSTDIPFKEGQRVTTDISAGISGTKDIKQKHQKLDELRRAVIWSEILTPKFNRL